MNLETWIIVNGKPYLLIDRYLYIIQVPGTDNLWLRKVRSNRATYLLRDKKGRFVSIPVILS